MRSVIFSSLLALAAAVPVERASGPTDVQILNYALTLEHLEATFYAEAVAKFNAKDFELAGAPAPFYQNLQRIAGDEKTHVSFLTSAIKGAGGQAVAACTYNFDLSSAANVLLTANILEGVGVSAYLGAAQYIANKAYLTAAGSILTVEARHSAYLRANQNPVQAPNPSPFDIPLDFNEVYTLAALFIKSCPSSNPALPVKAFPELTVTAIHPGGLTVPGDVVSVEAAWNCNAKAAYFITTTGPVQAKLTGSGKTYQVTVPKGVQGGQEYLVLTSAVAAPTDDNIVAGPAIVPIRAT